MYIKIYSFSLKFLLIILCFFLFSSYSYKEQDNSIIGKWQYLDCTIKNTSVNGTIQFFKNSTFFFKGEVHQDFPTKPFNCKYQYKVSGNMLYCLTKTFPPFKNPPICEYFLIQENMLYFSNIPITEIVDNRTGNSHITNWVYSLKRLK